LVHSEGEAVLKSFSDFRKVEIKFVLLHVLQHGVVVLSPI